MLRNIFLAGFVVVSVNIAFSQVMWETVERHPIHWYRQADHLPGWARTFADSILKKVLIEPSNGTSPATERVRPNLPPGVRPVDYIGRDGLPGDPLPAVHDRIQGRYFEYFKRTDPEGYELLKKWKIAK